MIMVNGASFILFFSDTATSEIYTYCHTLSLPDALPIDFRRRHPAHGGRRGQRRAADGAEAGAGADGGECEAAAVMTEEGIGHVVELARSEEHTSELQSLMRISYAVF